MPVVCSGLAFHRAGLYRHEAPRNAVLVSSVALFYISCAFAYYLVLPNVFAFLLGITRGVSMMTDIGRYLDFVLTLFLAFGLCFGVGGRRDHCTARLGHAHFVEQPPYVISACSSLPRSWRRPGHLMIMLAIPHCLLYELGVIATRVLVHPAGAMRRTAARITDLLQRGDAFGGFVFLHKGIKCQVQYPQYSIIHSTPSNSLNPEESPPWPERTPATPACVSRKCAIA